MPQPFLDIAFPNAVARGATGGPGFSTNVVTLGSGSERRNIQWSNARGDWNISTGIRTRAEMQAWLLGIWEAERRSVLFVTHSIEEALTLSDRIYVLSPAPARVLRELRVPFPRPRSGAAIASAVVRIRRSRSRSTR